MVNVALVGTSELIRKQLKTWSRLKDVNVSGIVLTDNEQQSTSLHEYQERVVNSIADLLSLQLDIIDICVPFNERLPYVHDCLKEGIHVFCEVPFTEDEQEILSIVKKYEETGAILYTGNTRFSPEYVDANKHVTEGKIGKPGVIRLSSSAPHPGKGADIFLELGMPEFDWIIWTLGNVERVMAKHVKKKHPNGRLVEYGLITLRLEDQSFAHVELSWATNRTESSFELTGDKGMITYYSKDSQPISMELLSNDANDRLEEDYKDHWKLLQREAVMKSIVSRKPLLPKAEMSIGALQVALAAKKAAMSNQPVLLGRGDLT